MTRRKKTPPSDELKTSSKMTRRQRVFSIEAHRRYILVVDDCKKTRDDIYHALNNFDYEVITARDGEEAWKIIMNRRIDLILTELIIPKTTGTDLLRKVKMHAPKIGVIVLTNYGGVESYLESMSLGVFEYLTKPIKVFELERIIDRFFHYIEIPTRNSRLYHRPTSTSY